MDFKADFRINDEELAAYLEAIKEKNGGTLEGIESVSLKLDNDDVLIDYVVKTPKFERIRRITGYLSSTLDRWNNAKQKEEHDRVKHTGFSNMIRNF